MPVPNDPNIVQQVLDLAVRIQQIPAPTFHETARAEFLRSLFSQEGLEDISVDSIGNVYARFPGTGIKPPLVVSAHTDTVFPHGINLEVHHEKDRITGPGIGDNSLGVASLFGLLWMLRQGIHSGQMSPLPGDLWLVANVGEEGLGDLKGMRAVVERFGKEVLGYLVLEGMSLGQIYHRGLGVERYLITVKTPGGHSWVNFGSPSAIHELAGIIMRLTALPIPESPRTSINIGVVQGGTTVNTIAAEAHLELDLRSEDEKTLQQLVRQVSALVEGSRSANVDVSLEMIGRRPAGAIPAHHPLVHTARACLMELGMKPVLNIGSTDANIPLSLGYPAVCIGLTFGNGAHTEAEYIEKAPLALGLAQLLMLVETISGTPSKI